jgi:hypothetical protein
MFLLGANPLSRSDVLRNEATLSIWWAGIVLAVVNLIPVIPLDGGAIDELRHFASIVDIDAIAGLPADAQVPEGQPIAPGEMPRFCPALKERWLLRVERLDSEVRDAAHEVPARILPRSDS